MLPTKVTQKIRNNLKALKSLAGVAVNTSVLERIASVFCQILGMKSRQSVGLVYQSCLHLLYTTPDDTTIIETFRKVAINDQYIWQGFSIPGWHGEPVRVLIGIVRASESLYKGTHMTRIHFRVLSGLPAGMLLELTSPSWWVCKIIRRKIGLWRSHIQPHSTDIAGTSFTVRLSVKTDGKVVWDNITATKKQKEENKDQTRHSALKVPSHLTVC